MAEGLDPSWSYGASAQEDELDRFYLDCYSVVWNLLKFLFPDFIDLCEYFEEGEEGDAVFGVDAI